MPSSPWMNPPEHRQGRGALTRERGSRRPGGASGPEEAGSADIGGVP